MGVVQHHRTLLKFAHTKAQTTPTTQHLSSLSFSPLLLLISSSQPQGNDTMLPSLLFSFYSFQLSFQIDDVCG